MRAFNNQSSCRRLERRLRVVQDAANAKSIFILALMNRYDSRTYQSRRETSKNITKRYAIVVWRLDAEVLHASMSLDLNSSLKCLTPTRSSARSLSTIKGAPEALMPGSSTELHVDAMNHRRGERFCSDDRNLSTSSSYANVVQPGKLHP